MSAFFSGQSLRPFPGDSMAKRKREDQRYLFAAPVVPIPTSCFAERVMARGFLRCFDNIRPYHIITIRLNFQQDEELVAFDQAQSALLSWIADCCWLQKISCIIEREMCGTFLAQLREI